MKLNIQHSAASAATFALLTTGAFAAQQDVTFQVSALTSSNDAAVGVPVSIETNQGTLGLYSDGEGRTEGASLPGGTATTITLHEAFVSGGKLLGQRWNKDMPYSSGPDELYLLEHEHAQPLGIPRVLNRPRRMTTPRGHSRWEIGTPAVVDWRAPNVPFQAHVASLLTSREIEAYFQYQAPGAAPQGGTVGLCISCDGGTIGTGGMILSLDVRGHGLPVNPKVTTYHVTDDFTALGSSSFTATLLSIESDRAYIELNGHLPAGDSIVTVSTGAGGSVGPIGFLGSPPTFTYTGPSGSSSFQRMTCEDCTIATPQPNFTCDESIQNTSVNGCPAASKGPGTENATMNVLGEICKGPGGGTPTKLRKGWHKGKSVTKTVTENWEGGSHSSSETGTMDYEVEIEDDSSAYTAGTGCGQCKGWVQWTYKKVWTETYFERWNLLYFGHFIGLLEGTPSDCRRRTQDFTCTGMGPLRPTTCNRTGTP